MASPYKLAPTSAAPISYTHSDIQSPYVDAWYQADKLEGETLSDFVCRQTTLSALRRRDRWSRGQIEATGKTSRDTADTTQTADQGLSDGDHQAELIACGVA